MIELFHGKAEDIMPTLPQGCADAVICDPPFGTTQSPWDVVIPFEDMWRCIKHTLKPRGAVVLFGSEPFSSLLRCSNLDWFKYDWIWEKHCPTGFMDARRRPLKSHETISVFCDAAPPYNPQGVRGCAVHSGRRNKAGNGVYGNVGNPNYVQRDGNFPRSVLRYDRLTHNQQHPNQKPVPLLEYLIKTYTNEGETVLDFTAGSGTTAVAAYKTGRNCIAIEKDAQYFEVMQRRVAEVEMQPQLELTA